MALLLSPAFSLEEDSAVLVLPELLLVLLPVEPQPASRVTAMAPVRISDIAFLLFIFISLL